MINFTLWLTVCFGGKFRQRERLRWGPGVAPMLGFVVIIRHGKVVSPAYSMRTRWHNRPFVRTTYALRRSHGGFPRLDMPLHYGSQIDEHHAVRTDAGCLMCHI